MPKTRYLFLVFAIFALLNYWPVFRGRIPLPTDNILGAPIFEEYWGNRDWESKHAEMSDAVTQFYQWRVFTGDNLRNGVIPLWNPYMLSGTPFLANGQSGIFYPPHWSFILLPGTIAWPFEVMLKMTLAGFFTALFLTSIGATTRGAIAAGIVFAGCGFMTSWQLFPHTDSAIWIPLGCYGIRRLRVEMSNRSLVLTAFALAMPMLGGHPGIAAHAAILTGFYAVWQFVSISDHRWKYLARFTGAGLLALGVASVQLLPTASWVGLTTRSEITPIWGPMKQSESLALFSRDVGANPNSAGFDIPNAAVYAGAMTLLLAALAIFHNRREASFYLTVLFVIAAITYGVQPFLSLANTIPFYQALKKEEGLLLIDFAFAVLAGLGLGALESWNPIQRLKWQRPVALIAVAIVVTIAAAGSFHVYRLTTAAPSWWRSVEMFWFLLALSAGAVALRLFKQTGRNWATFCCVVIAGDIFTFAHGYTPFQRASTVFPPSRTHEWLTAQTPPFRVAMVDNASIINLETMYGLEGAAGYDFELTRFYRLTEDVTHPYNTIVFSSEEMLANPNRVIDLLNIKYLITTNYDKSTENLSKQHDRFRKVWTHTNIDIFENLNVLPRVTFVPEWGITVKESEKEQLTAVTNPDFDVLKNVILPAYPQGVSNSAALAGPAPQYRSSVESYKQRINDLEIKASVSESSVLVLSQIFFPDWKVYVDGKHAPLLRANYAFTGVRLNAGTHDIRFQFIPANFVRGVILCVISLGIALKLLLSSR